jgi:hypothetical protein
MTSQRARQSSIKSLSGSHPALPNAFQDDLLFSANTDGDLTSDSKSAKHLKTSSMTSQRARQTSIVSLSGSNHPPSTIDSQDFIPSANTDGGFPIFNFEEIPVEDSSSARNNAKGVENLQDYPKRCNQRFSLSKGNIPHLPQLPGIEDEEDIITDLMFSSPSTPSLTVEHRTTTNNRSWIPWSKSKTTDDCNDTQIQNRSKSLTIFMYQPDLDNGKNSKQTDKEVSTGSIRANISNDGIQEYFIVLTSTKLKFYKGV